MKVLFSDRIALKELGSVLEWGYDIPNKTEAKALELLSNLSAILTANQLNNYVLKEGKTLLHVAAERGWGTLVRALLEKGANANIYDSFGRIALYYAIANGHLAATRLLLPVIEGQVSSRPWFSIRSRLRTNPAINRQDAWNATMLHYAAENGWADVVQQLLEKGADANIADVDGKLPMWTALWNANPNNTNYGPGYDTGYDQTALLLLQSTDRHKLPELHEIATFGLPRFCQALLNQGANPNSRDSEGNTALHLIALKLRDHNFERLISIFRLLLQNRADTSLSNKQGQTIESFIAGNTRLSEQNKRAVLDALKTPNYAGAFVLARRLASPGNQQASSIQSIGSRP
ncbi:MAG: hypothetical protein K0Q57_1 [Gammaproteobacteria bacterium]|jgi:ankyrin repeat protein|nr:hypothetical protein [Gammaproteobacteria bacterium]